MNSSNMRYLNKMTLDSLIAVFLIVMFMTAMLPLTTADGAAPEILVPPLKTVPLVDDCVWNVSSGEWDDAPEYEISNGVNVSYVRMKHNSTHLFVMIDSPWDTKRAKWFESETTWLAFDTGHDHGLVPQPDDYLFDTEYSSTGETHGHGVAWRGNGTAGTEWAPISYIHTDAGYLAESTSGWHHTLVPSPHSATPHRFEELRIPLAFIDEIGQTVGFYLMVIDDFYDPDGSGPEPSGSYIEWPAAAGGDSSGWPFPPNYRDPCPPPNNWGHLTLLTNPLPPVASFTYSPPKLYVNGTVTFNASASSDLDGRITSYEWDFGDNTTDAGKIVNHTYSVEGTCTVTLNVTDNQGLWNTTSKTLTVLLAPPPPYGPTADFVYSPSSPVAGKNVTFDARVSLVGWNGSHIMDIVNYTWNFGDTTVTTVSIPVINHSYVAGGSYTVNLTVTDAQRWSNSTFKTLNVSKASSQVLLEVNPVSITLGDQVSISVVVSSDGEPIANVVALIESRKAGTATWSIVGQSETNSTGGWSVSWAPTETGTFEVRGSWDGDAGTEGAESELKTVTVKEATPVEEPIPIWEIAAITVVVVAILAVIGIYLLKIRKRKA